METYSLDNIKGNRTLQETGIGCSGLMKPTIYDTAWVARVPAENDPARPAFPEAMNWLRESQHLDGSWGAEIHYTHDRVISTMATILALSQLGGGNSDRRAIENGIQYIWENTGQLDHECETIGFEVILPTFLAKFQEMNLQLPYAAFEQQEKNRREKLSKIPADLIHSRHTTLAFSLEFMGDDLDTGQASAIQESDGSVAVSPSATAYLLTQNPENRSARNYLNQVVNAYDGKAPQVFPFDIFETAWTLWNLLVAGVGTSPHARQHLDDLKTLWDRKRGTGFSSNYSNIDVDVSAVVFRVLSLGGLEPDPAPLYAFEQEEYFQCYSFERNPSTSANIHVLDALKDINAKAAEKVRDWLASVRVEGAYWKDKWHASPYYPTAHAIIALLGVDPGLAKTAVDWMLEMQRPDGCWGYFSRPTAEETAYCLQALSLYSRSVERVDPKVIQRGRQGLAACPHDHPALWIGKCLYTPVRVVESAIQSAFILTAP